MKNLRAVASKIYSLASFKNLKIGLKLFLVFGLINTCVILFTTFVFFRMNQSKSELDNLISRTNQAAQSIVPASEKIINSSYEQLDLGEKVNLIYVNVRKARKLHGKLSQESVDQDAAQALKKVDADSIELISQARDMIDNNKRIVEETASAFETLKHEIEDFGGISQLNDIMAALKTETLIGSMIILVVSILAYFMLWKRIAAPISNVVGVIKDVSEGKLIAGAEINSTDELGQMGQAANEMARKLGSTVMGVASSFSEVEQVGSILGDTADSIEEGTIQEEKVITQLDEAIKTISISVENVITEMENMMNSATSNLSSLTELSSSVKEVAGIADDVASSANESATSIQEMSASITQVSTGVANMTALIVETASSMSQMDQAIQQIKENTGKTSDTAKSLFAEASDKGRGAMLRAKNCMDKIRALITTLGDTVNEVGKSSDGIDAMTNLIFDVSDQTSLLALNASILAAQAGESGRGFSVVAEEIRSLSSRTDSSLKEIEKYVRDIQQGSKEAVKQVALGIDGVTDGVKEMANMETVFEKIIEGINSTKELTGDIAKQTNFQSKGSASVAKSLTDLSASAQQFSASMQEQDRTARHIMKMAEISGDKTQQTKVATDQQATSVKEIEKEVEKTVSMAKQLAENSAGTRGSLNTLRESMVVIQEVMRNNQQRIQALRQSVDLLAEHAGDVKQRISIFSVGTLDQTVSTENRKTD